jgi:hypothetical protein
MVNIFPSAIGSLKVVKNFSAFYHTFFVNKNVNLGGHHVVFLCNHSTFVTSDLFSRHLVQTYATGGNNILEHLMSYSQQ